MIIMIMLLCIRASRSFLPEASTTRTRSPIQPSDSKVWALSHAPWKSMREGTCHSAQHSVRNGKWLPLELYCPKPYCHLWQDYVLNSQPGAISIPLDHVLIIHRAVLTPVLWDRAGGAGVTSWTLHFTKSTTGVTFIAYPHHSDLGNGLWPMGDGAGF